MTEKVHRRRRIPSGHGEPRSIARGWTWIFAHAIAELVPPASEDAPSGAVGANGTGDVGVKSTPFISERKELLTGLEREEVFPGFIRGDFRNFHLS